MKFALLASYPGSLLSFRGELVAEIRRKGFDIAALLPGLESDPYGEFAELAAAGIDCYRVRLNRTGTSIWQDILYFWDVSWAMVRLRPDVVLAYTVKPVVFGLLSASLLRAGKRYALITGLGYAFTGARRTVVSRIVLFLYRLSLRNVDKVFFQNTDDLRLFAEMGILRKSVPSVVVNGSGVDLTRFSFCHVEAAFPTFLMIARLLGDKGIREYVAAAAQVKIRFPESRFLLAGWLDSNPDSIGESELAVWQANNIVEFLGKLDDVRPAIAASTVYVLPSYREGTPRTVLEAMAMGRPIITTDAPGCRETVIDGDNGFLVPVQSVDALVDAMLKFIEDPALAPRMGRRSREIAEDKYDVHKVNAVMLREMGITAAAKDVEGQP